VLQHLLSEVQQKEHTTSHSLQNTFTVDFSLSPTFFVFLYTPSFAGDSNFILPLAHGTLFPPSVIHPVRRCIFQVFSTGCCGHCVKLDTENIFLRI
jgi:hypothetical protein